MQDGVLCVVQAHVGVHVRGTKLGRAREDVLVDPDLT